MGIKVEVVEAGAYIAVECPLCKHINSALKMGGQTEGNKICIYCGAKLHWEETEDELTV